MRKLYNVSTAGAGKFALYATHWQIFIHAHTHTHTCIRVCIYAQYRRQKRRAARNACAFSVSNAERRRKSCACAAEHKVNMRACVQHKTGFQISSRTATTTTHSSAKVRRTFTHTHTYILYSAHADAPLHHIFRVANDLHACQLRTRRDDDFSFMIRLAGRAIERVHSVPMRT